MRKVFHKRLFSYMYDAVVIGGGSGGISFAVEYAKGGKKVAVLDRTLPSLHDSTWELGGTCLNVGCVPKKFFHYSSIKNPGVWGDCYGYSVEESEMERNWGKLFENVQMYVGMMNFKTRSSLMTNEIDFFREYASLVDGHSVKFTTEENEETLLTAENIVIASGLRPRRLNIPGSDLAITSSDLFTSEEDPGKTLLIGGSFISLECAGFLESNATVMAREVVLRGFDQECADFVQADMEEYCGVTFLLNCQPVEIALLDSGEKKVVYEQMVRDAESGEVVEREIVEDVFDTVMFCVGRETSGLLTEKMNVSESSTGIELDSTGKIKVDDKHRTTNESVFAIGDCNNAGLELTTVASAQGENLARYLLSGESEDDHSPIDYENLAVTSFLPLEYGMIGHSEATARAEYGDVEVYAQSIDLMEYQITDYFMERKGFLKVVCSADSSERVLGMHIIAPNACDITQGFAVAMRLGLKKSDLDDTIGIHPSVAEKLTTLKKGKTSDGSC